MSGEMSMPVTEYPQRASSSLSQPGPQPTSSTSARSPSWSSWTTCAKVRRQRISSGFGGAPNGFVLSQLRPAESSCST